MYQNNKHTCIIKLKRPILIKSIAGCDGHRFPCYITSGHSRCSPAKDSFYLRLVDVGRADLLTMLQRFSDCLTPCTSALLGGVGCPSKPGSATDGGPLRYSTLNYSMSEINWYNFSFTLFIIWDFAFPKVLITIPCDNE